MLLHVLCIWSNLCNLKYKEDSHNKKLQGTAYIAGVTQELLDKQEYSTLAQLKECKNRIDGYAFDATTFRQKYSKENQFTECFPFQDGSTWNLHAV